MKFIKKLTKFLKISDNSVCNVGFSQRFTNFPDFGMGDVYPVSPGDAFDYSRFSVNHNKLILKVRLYYLLNYFYSGVRCCFVSREEE